MRTSLILYLLLISTISQAQNEKKDNIMAPTLNGHEVNSLSFMRSAFNTTQVYFNLGLGYTAVYSATGISIGDSTIYQLSSELVFTQLSLGYQQRIKDWVSIYSRMEYAARLGSGVESIIVAGINTSTTVELGLSFKLSEGKKHRIAGYTQMTNAITEIIDIKQYVVELINEDERASVNKTIPHLDAGAGITMSLAPYKFLGINFDGNMAYSESLTRGVIKIGYFAGGNLDFMMNDLIKIPISIVVGGRISNRETYISDEDNFTSDFVAKILYNGADDFIISIEIHKGQTPIDDGSRRVEFSTFIFNSVFYF